MPHMPQDAVSLNQGRNPWRMTMLTLFPDLFPGPLGASLTGQALTAGLWSLETINIRDFGIGRHRAVDDSPTGGGAGMVLRADVLAACIDQAREKSPDAPVIYLSPRGEPFTQAHAVEFARGPGLTMLAGRFEGVDERVITGRNLREISIGDYVLSGGELAAMVVADACLRLIPGVIGAADSLSEESFENGLLEYPQYTKPREFEGQSAPEILLSGDHAKIAAWRRAQSASLTAARRPDLTRNNVIISKLSR
jgi:tRNA (guanine37-N1)-methyltransferase